MRDVDLAPRFGAELKDGFKPANAWVGIGISWLDDIQQFYRERSTIEKEYASKLNGLAKKYIDKKGRKSSTLSVGEQPTVTPGSLECASATTWQKQLEVLESRAADHDKLSAQLIAHLAEPLKALASRSEDLRKAHTDFAIKLDKERESTFGDLRKVKGKYDAACQEMESRRKKADGTFDFAKQKAQHNYAQQMNDMNNLKNVYLININATNRQKELHYHTYVPELLDSLQGLNEARVSRLNKIWTTAADLEAATLIKGAESMKALKAEISNNNPILDSMMFARHNPTQGQEPADFVFEPSPVWHDDDALATDEIARTYLLNILTKSKDQVGPLSREVDRKRREVEGAKRVNQAIRDGQDNRDEVEISKGLFVLEDKLYEAEKKKVMAETEISTITSAIGDVSVGAQTHDFKQQTFKIPTNCDLCGERIWGLSAKGFDCRDCGYTCHSKCEMKVPADCPGEQSKEDRKRLKAERQDAAREKQTVPASSSSHDPSVTGTPAEVSANSSQRSVSMKANNTNKSTSGGLSRSDTIGTLATLGSGLSARVHRSTSATSSRVELDGRPLETRSVAAPPPPARPLPPMQSASEGLEQRARMLYPYQKNDEGEISVEDGREVVVLEPDDGSGWIRVRCGPRVEGLVPASYAEILPRTSTPTVRPTSPLPSTTTTNTSSLSPDRPGSVYSAGSTTSLANSINSNSGGGVGIGAGGTKKKGPAVAPKRGAKKLRYVEAMYGYEARSGSEHSMVEGERFVLVNGDGGDGWVDVERGGAVGSVPASYVRDV